MLPILEELRGLSKEEVLKEIKRCYEISKSYGKPFPVEQITDLYLKELGFNVKQENKTTE